MVAQLTGMIFPENHHGQDKLELPNDQFPVSLIAQLVQQV